MSERATEKLTTPSGKIITIKTYLTARETLPIFGNEQLSAQQKTHELAIAGTVYIDGQNEGIGELLLDLPLPDYTCLLTRIREIADGDFQKAK